MAKQLPQLQKLEDIPDIPLAIKKASAIILEKYGYTERQIAQTLGMANSTTHRAIEGDVSEIDAESWSIAEQAITKLMHVKRDQLSSKILAKMEEQVDSKPLPFGSLAFALKVIGELQNPKGNTNIAIKGDNIGVQVIRGNVSYNNKDSNSEAK